MESDGSQTGRYRYVCKADSSILENRSGRLADVTKILGEHGVDISALSVADTTGFGILRLIVSNPVLAESVLKEKGYAVSISEVLAIAISDTPGSLSAALAVLDENQIEIEYIYAFVGKTDKRALVILKVTNMDAAVSVLKNTDALVLSDEEVYAL